MALNMGSVAESWHEWALQSAFEVGSGLGLEAKAGPFFAFYPAWSRHASISAYGIGYRSAIYLGLAAVSNTCDGDKCHVQSTYSTRRHDRCMYHRSERSFAAAAA
jgi:hypothetical protein